VHSSISNSNERAPSAPYALIWGLSLLLTIIFLTGLETLWRTSGYLPSVTDDMFLWSYYRSKVYSNHGNRRIVILGSSRSMLGIVPEVLESYFPGRKVIHLAVDGHNPYATFKDLAEDPKFDGIILFDATEKAFFPNNQRAQEPWVKYFRKEWASWSRFEKILNMRIQVFLQSKLVIFNSLLNLRQLAVYHFKIPPMYYTFRPDRYRPAYYYSMMTPEQLEEHRQRRLEIARSRDDLPTPESEREFEQILREQVKPLVDQLRANGGDIIFLRMPTCGEHWEIDQRLYPKERFWDKIQPITGGQAIHFIDYESLSKFDCPDTSHLDATEAPEFTANLAQSMLERLPELAVHTKGIAP